MPCGMDLTNAPKTTPQVRGWHEVWRPSEPVRHHRQHGARLAQARRRDRTPASSPVAKGALASHTRAIRAPPHGNLGLVGRYPRMRQRFEAVPSGPLRAPRRDPSESYTLERRGQGRAPARRFPPRSHQRHRGDDGRWPCWLDYDNDGWLDLVRHQLVQRLRLSPEEARATERPLPQRPRPLRRRDTRSGAGRVKGEGASRRISTATATPTST